MKSTAQYSNKKVTETHKKRVLAQLQAHGVTWWGLLSAESRFLPTLIRPDEQITGVLIGRNEAGTAMLAATDRRVIFLDCKPMFVSQKELMYGIVSGISCSNVGLYSTVILHTRMGDFKLRTLNQRCASQFVRYIEFRCLEEEEKKGGAYDRTSLYQVRNRIMAQKGIVPWRSLGKMALERY